MDQIPVLIAAKDYKGAILDLKITIDSIPENHLNDRPQGSSEYADTYFTLAMAEYLNNEKKIRLAASTWMLNRPIFL